MPDGALFYAETKRRKIIAFDVDLRAITQDTIVALAEVFTSQTTPPPTPKGERCRACSLSELCRPDAVAKPARAWRARTVARLLAEREGKVGSDHQT